MHALVAKIGKHIQTYGVFQYVGTPCFSCFKDVPGGFPKSDLLGVTVALIHVVRHQFLAV